MAQLLSSSRATSALGFGCAALSAGSSGRHSIKLVHAAIDAGIQHFDVAPPYGMGTAEDVLGMALKNRRQDVTIATKVGIGRPRQAWAVMAVRSIAAPLRHLMPGLTRRAGASAYSGLTAQIPLEPRIVEASLTESIRRLQTDYVDLLLLHEITPDKITDELLSFLEKLKKKGLVSALGTGTSYTNTLAIRAKYPLFFDVWQYSWSVLDTDKQRPVNYTITHSAIHKAIARFRDWLHSDPAKIHRLSDATGVDLSCAQNLSKVLIGASVANNPVGSTLVASRSVAHIQDNSRLLSDRYYIAAGQQLTDALAAEPETVLR